jgi:hypothetical protein
MRIDDFRLPYGKSSRAYLFEVVQVPFMVLTRPMSWQIIRLLVAHDLGADLELLLWKSVYIQLQNLNRMRTFLCASSTSVGGAMFAVSRLIFVFWVGSIVLELF